MSHLYTVLRLTRKDHTSFCELKLDFYVTTQPKFVFSTLGLSIVNQNFSFSFVIKWTDFNKITRCSFNEVCCVLHGVESRLRFDTNDSIVTHTAYYIYKNRLKLFSAFHMFTSTYLTITCSVDHFWISSVYQRGCATHDTHTLKGSL